MAVKLVARSAEATAVAAEVAALYDLNHRNIVPFIGWAEDDNFQCVVPEYMENGSLDNYLISPGSTGEEGVMMLWVVVVFRTRQFDDG